MSKNKAPICIEEGCQRRVPRRNNYHTMSDEWAIDADEYHHRCRLCYVNWLCRDFGKKTTKTRKSYECEGCDRVIEKGQYYNLAHRTAFLYARYPERVHICKECVEIQGVT